MRLPNGCRTNWPADIKRKAGSSSSTHLEMPYLKTTGRRRSRNTLRIGVFNSGRSGNRNSGSLKRLGAAIANDPEASRLSWQAFYRLSPKDRQAVLQNEQWYQSYQGGAVNPAGARNIALMKQLSTLGKEGEIADIAGKALHQESRPTGVANAYSDLSAPSMDSSLPSQVQQATAPAAGLQSHIDRQSLLNKAHTGVSADAKSLSAQAPPDEIQQHAQAGQQSVIQQAHAMNQAVSKPEEDKAWSRLMAAPENPTLNVRSWGALDNMP